ncbi:hypothetical protein Fcan01_25027 [Folsomia candida]|uniref:Uncharacterized protein n=1 Tax=Folsomia candida TaxID=158441 RepID=A0A226D3N6_FOLCA|nr:hypothetical protein Fcan01_25027 [Folsomia candida]
MATLISKIFGNIEHLENINFRLSGDHNSGNISHNKNIVVTCTASIFNLFHNTNITIEAKSSKIELCECANVLIFGSDNEIVFKTSSHLKFHGDGNNCSGSLNRNVKHDCNQSKSVLERNSDIKLSGNRNNVVAKDNTNLSISGDGHQIIVENADSHIITRGENSLGIEKESDFGQPGSKLIRFLISYNGQATINKDFCKLGNIKLKKTFDRCHVDIEIHMPESVQVVHKTAGKIIVSGISNTGEKEQLTITGPQVDQISQKMNCFRITFDNTS